MRFELTASPGLNRSGLPVAYRAMRAPRQDSTLQHTRLNRAAHPGWTRTTDRLLVGELPSPLGHRTMFFCSAVARLFAARQPLSGSRGTRTHNGLAPVTGFQNRLLIQPDDFQVGGGARDERRGGSATFSSLLPKDAGAGLEPALRRSERRVLPLNDPAFCSESFSCGCRNRTRADVVQSHVCRPADTPQSERDGQDSNPRAVA